MPRLIALFTALLLALVAGRVLAQAAYVHELTGRATATVGTAQRALSTGDTVESGATVTTAEQSRAVLKFEDGQIISLAERSTFRIVDYRYNKERVRESSATFSLLAGAMRFVTGVIGSTNPASVRMQTPTATMGIRGTDGVISIEAVTQAVTLAVTAGQVAITTAQGTQNVGAGNFADAQPNQAPRSPGPIAQATPAVQAALSGFAAQGLPINTPVVVRTSAQAAAAASRAAADPSNAGLQRAAQEALDRAVTAAQDAFKAAVDAGAVPPAPPSPPPSSTPGTTGATGATSPTSTTGATSTGAAGAGGAGGAGGGGGGGTTTGVSVTPTTTCTSGSASPC